MGCCDDGIELSSPIKGGEFLDHLSDISGRALLRGVS